MRRMLQGADPMYSRTFGIPGGAAAMAVFFSLVVTAKAMQHNDRLSDLLDTVRPPSQVRTWMRWHMAVDKIKQFLAQLSRQGPFTDFQIPIGNLVSFGRQQVHFLQTSARRFVLEDREKLGHVVALAGPVYIIRSDESGCADSPVYCVSVPEIAFQDLHPDAELKGDVKERMRGTWELALTVFRNANIRYPVLSSMGMASYTHPKSKHGQIVRAYADAFFDVLKTFQTKYQFEQIIVALGDSMEYTEWKQASGRYTNLGVTLLQGDMIAVADALVRGKMSTGILNTTSLSALKTGALGRNWMGNEKFPYDREELIAVETTLLLQDVTYNPSLWNSLPTKVKT